MNTKTEAHIIDLSTADNLSSQLMEEAYNLLSDPDGSRPMVVGQLKHESGRHAVGVFLKNRNTWIMYAPELAMIQGTVFLAHPDEHMQEVGQGLLLTATLSTSTPEAPTQKRWTARISFLNPEGDVVGHEKYQIEEVEELQHLIEQGPTWQTGYSAEIKLTYNL